MNDINKYLKSLTGTEIAIIGLSFKFPGADNLEDFWKRLSSGDEMIRYFSDDELEQLGVSKENINNQSYVKATIEELPHKDHFDNHFFGYTPEEAHVMDPQTRVFHELAWEALEASGYIKNRGNHKIGVFAGSSSSYNHELLNTLYGKTNKIGHFNAHRLANKDYMCSRVAYSLNLTGPVYAVNTTCSTSLVAIHLASRAILTGECKMALAGGISIFPDKPRGYLYEEGGVLSRDGHCRAFDATSSGTNFGEGGGIVVLKRLKDAVQDRDIIHAVIKGSSVNNDGRRKVGYTAPSIAGQKEVIRMAHKMARTDPNTLSFVEAHGTGTSLGDPIEIEALKMAFNNNNPEKKCAISSVKTNLGHLDCAAGIAGLIKSILSLKNRKIPPSVNFKIPNPKIQFEGSPFYVNDELREWEFKGDPMKGAVSSFGIGGTNVHMVLEEGPAFTREVPKDSMQLITLSTKSSNSLEQARKKFGEFFGECNVNFTDISNTLHQREEFTNRLFFVASNKNEASDILKNQNDKIHFGKTDESKKKLVFVFPGQGSQYYGIAAELYEKDSFFGQEVNRCLDMIPSPISSKLKNIICNKAVVNERSIIETDIAQVLLFVVQYSLTQSLKRIGVTPDVMIGHSLGEYVAACISGIFSLEDALTMILKRGELMQKTAVGIMINVEATESELTSYISDDVAVAAINSEESCVLSGSPEKVEDLIILLDKNGIVYKKLNTNRAFHSSLMKSIVDEFRSVLEQVQYNVPKTPFISNLSGNYISESEVSSPDYWIQHLLGTVRFSDGIKTLKELENKVILEVGTKGSLSSYIRKIYKDEEKLNIISLIRHPKESRSDLKCYMEAIGHIWLTGKEVDWELLDENNLGKTTLIPSYPFEHKYFGNPKDFFDIINEKSLFNILDSNNDQFTYNLIWKKAYRDYKIANKKSAILISNSTSDSLYESILESNTCSEVICVLNSDKFDVNESKYSTNLKNELECLQLFKAIKKQGSDPNVIILSIISNDNLVCKLDANGYNRTIDNLLSLINICKGINKVFTETKIELKIINNNSCEIIGKDLLSPYQSAFNGVAGVVNNEFTNIECSVIDVDLQEEKWCNEFLINVILSSTEKQNIIGLRRGYEWIRSLEPIQFDKTLEVTALQNAKTILITGGLGGLGLAFANDFVNGYKVNIVLISRTELPQRDLWSLWLNNKPESDTISIKIRSIQNLEAKGAEVRYFAIDLADEEAMSNMQKAVTQEFGEIDGVIHAAGIAGRKIIERIDETELDNQWRAKVRGLGVLNNLFSNKKLKFFINFSTINSINPQLGQLGYSTANSVLDAFIYSNNILDCDCVKTINWDTWKEIGMAHESQKAKHLYLNNITIENAHPLIDYKGYDIDDRILFVSHVSPNKHWLLDEHRVINGKSVFPGTGYVELLFEITGHLSNKTEPVKIENMYFIAPMLFLDDEPKVIKTVVEEREGFYDVKISSHPHNNPNEFILHVQANLVFGGEIKFNQHVLKNYLALSEEHKTEVDYNLIQSEELGPRWNNLRWLNTNEDSAFAYLKLPEEYNQDVETYKLHPALLDIATGFFYMIINKDSEYLPFCYERIIIGDNLPSEIYSHITWNKDNKSDNLVFDITIWNIIGEVVLQVVGLTYMSLKKNGVAQQQQHREKGIEKNTPPINIEGVSTEKNLEIFNQFMKSRHPQMCIQSKTNTSMDFLTSNLEEEVQFEKLERDSTSVPYVEPAGETEIKMSIEWQNFFGIKEVGASDNFFELGGDSVKVSIIISRLNRLFETNISLIDFFNKPTIRELSTMIESSEKSKLYTINVSEKREYYELSAAQKRIHILELLNGDGTLYNITEGFVVEGDFDKIRFESAFESLLKRHESLRTGIVKINNQYYQRVYENVAANIEYYETMESSINDNLHQFRRPFDMETAPLIRVGVFQINKNKNYVVIDLLHIIADGTSLLLIINEFLSLYQNIEMPPITKQYKDFAEWQHRLLKTGRIDKQKTFWKDQLSGDLRRIQLPYDHIKNQGPIRAAGNFEFSLSEGLTIELKKLAKNNDVTDFMTFLALLNVFFTKLSGQEDILIGIPHIGRVSEEFSNVIGMFINTVMLRNYPEGNKTFDNLLQEIKSNTLGAFDNLDFQYENILDMLRNEEKVDTENLLSVFFNYRNMFVESNKDGESTDSMKVSSAGLEDNFAKFDLSLYAYDFDKVFSFTCNYAEALFSKNTISYLMTQFTELIQQVVDNPTMKIEDYKILIQSSITTSEEEDVFNF